MFMALNSFQRVAYYVDQLSIVINLIIISRNVQFLGVYILI